MNFERNRKSFIEKFHGFWNRRFTFAHTQPKRIEPAPQVTTPQPIYKPEKVEPPKFEKYLNFRTYADWSEYRGKLDAVDALDYFAAKRRGGLEWFEVSLNKFKADIQKIKPEIFNEETTEKIVEGVITAAKNLIKALEDCDRAIRNPNKNSAPYEKLRGLIERYFEGIEIKRMNFKPGDSYDAWADLGLTEQPGIESTFYVYKFNTLKEIYVQPHYLEFIDEHDEIRRRVFGGKCAVYVRNRS